MLKTLKNLFKQDKEKFVVPKSVQSVIPIKTIWEDGIFLVGKNKYAKTFKFEDINYAVASREDTVIIAPITSRVHTKAKLPTHTLIKDFDGLDKNSIILFEQIRTIDKQRLREYLGTLDRRFIHCADKALAISIGLAKKD